MNGSTKTTLVRDLIAVLNTSDFTQRKVNKIYQIIRKAKKGVYHDFETTLASPKMQLHLDLVDVGFTNGQSTGSKHFKAKTGLALIDDKVKNGDYDENPDMSVDEILAQEKRAQN